MKIFSIKRLFVWGRSEDKVEGYCDYFLTKPASFDFQKIKSIEEAQNLDIDIIITATPSRKALVPNKVVKKKVHINAIGADMPGKQELDEKIFSYAKVITDSTVQCAKSGELQHALKAGVVNLDDVYSQLGEIISKNKKGRENPEEVTVFDSTGLGAHDLAMSNYVLEKYCKVNKIN